VFPNINYTLPINYLLNHINFSSKNRRLFFKVQISKSMLFLLILFKKHNLISSFYVYKNTKNNRLFCLISPSYNKNLQINFHYKSFHFIGRRIQISLKALNIIQHRAGNSLYILSTSSGIIDHVAALSSHKSGFLIGVIHS
jgi:ribosomal protein S8